NTSNTFGDFRPEVHDSDGLLMQTGQGEWIWHPLAWSKQLQSNAFKDDHPKGFGLMQRDRDFSHYQDLEAVYHKRPSAWIQPLSGFGQGEVRLIQLAARDEFMDNIVSFWTPARPPEPLQPVEIEYVIRWLGDAADLSPLGRCLSTRQDYQEQPYYRHFFLEFAGGDLGKLGEPPLVDVNSPTGAAINQIKIEKNDFNQSWRVSFETSTADNSKAVDLLCRLVTKEGAPLTETWSYTWMP
ncbi:MAG TPA: glucan biosynthesis protein, partial [Chthoniobacterales bacterium]